MKTFMIVLFTNITVICLLWLIGVFLIANNKENN